MTISLCCPSISCVLNPWNLINWIVWLSGLIGTGLLMSSTFGQVAEKAAFQFPQPNTKCIGRFAAWVLSSICLVQVLLKVKPLVLVLSQLLYQIWNVIISYNMLGIVNFSVGGSVQVDKTVLILFSCKRRRDFTPSFWPHTKILDCNTLKVSDVLANLRASCQCLRHLSVPIPNTYTRSTHHICSLYYNVKKSIIQMYRRRKSINFGSISQKFYKYLIIYFLKVRFNCIYTVANYEIREYQPRTKWYYLDNKTWLYIPHFYV